MFPLESQKCPRGHKGDIGGTSATCCKSSQNVANVPSKSHMFPFQSQMCPILCRKCADESNSLSLSLSLSLNPLLGILSCSFTPHIHLTILISAHWSASTFSFLMGQVSLPCKIPTNCWDCLAYKFYWCYWVGTILLRLSIHLNGLLVIRLHYVAWKPTSEMLTIWLGYVF